MSKEIENRLIAIREAIARKEKEGAVEGSTVVSANVPRVSVLESDYVFLNSKHEGQEMAQEPHDSVCSPTVEGEGGKQVISGRPQQSLWKEKLTARWIVGAGIALSVMGFAAFSMSGGHEDKGKEFGKKPDAQLIMPTHSSVIKRPSMAISTIPASEASIQSAVQPKKEEKPVATAGASAEDDPAHRKKRNSQSVVHGITEKHADEVKQARKVETAVVVIEEMNTPAPVQSVEPVEVEEMISRLKQAKDLKQEVLK
jgi:hypothetical protein